MTVYNRFNRRGRQSWPGHLRGAERTASGATIAIAAMGIKVPHPLGCRESVCVPAGGVPTDHPIATEPWGS